MKVRLSERKIMIGAVNQSPSFGSVYMIRVKKGTKPSEVMPLIKEAAMDVGKTLGAGTTKLNKSLADNEVAIAGYAPYSDGADRFLRIFDNLSKHDNKFFDALCKKFPNKAYKAK